MATDHNRQVGLLRHCCWKNCDGDWCAPCAYGSNAKDIRGDNCCQQCCLYYLLSLCLACACLASGPRRSLREKHGLKEEPCGDCCTHCLCATCAICQEAREVKYQALESAKGQFVAAPSAPAPEQQAMYYPPPPAPVVAEGYPAKVAQV